MNIWRAATPFILTGLLLLTGCAREAHLGDIVTVHFTGKRADATVFEDTRGGAPRQVHIGANLLLPAFEQALVGMKAGQKKNLLVKADHAFGPRQENPGMIQVLDKASLAHSADYEVGQRLNADITYLDGTKGRREVHVVAIDEKSVTVDANHPLAGQDLDFRIELVGFL